MKPNPHKPEAVKFMEFLRKDLEHNPYPVRLWVARMHRPSVRRSPMEIDRIRSVYVDWLIKLEEKHGGKKYGH